MPRPGPSSGPSRPTRSSRRSPATANGLTIRTTSGARWLDHNPVDGLRFEREKNPIRSVSTIEWYQKTRETIQRLTEEAQGDTERLKWTRLELALFIAEGTGRRRGSITGLRWEDFDFAKETIHWRVEHDKKGKDHVIPMPSPFMAELRRFRGRLGAATGPLFPYLRDPTKPMPADLLTQWLAKAESEAKLPKLPGSLWHAFRRKWASERMELPIKAVADAGGWSDTATIEKCYQQTSDAMLLRVMSEPSKRSDQRVG